MSGWRERQVNELGEVVTGRTPSTKRKDFYGGDYYLISPADLDNGKYVRTAHKRLTKLGFEQCRALPKNTVLVGCIGNVGKLGMVGNERSATNQQINALICNSENDPEFIYYCFYKNRDKLERRAVKTTLPILNKTNFGNFELFIPALSEQKKIAHILSTVQRAIEAQERIIQTTTELKKALMQKLFTEGLRNESQKQTEIGPVPKSWEVVPLANVVRSKLQNGAFVKKPETGNGFLFANVVDMYREIHLDLSRLERLNVPSESIEQYWLEEGDILVVRSSLKRDGIGQNCVARNLAESVFYDCHLICVQTDPDKLIPEFLSIFWRSDIGKNDLVLRSKTTTMTTINQQGISKALVPIAPIPEQSEIVEALGVVDSKIRKHRAQQSHLEDLFRTLLHELMTAKTRVHDINVTGMSASAKMAGEAMA